MSDDFDTRLLDLLYGELSPDEAAAFEAELAQDADAQKTVEGWSAVRRAVKDLPTPEPDPQVHYTILRAARDAVAPAKPRGLWAWLSGVVMNPAFAGVAVMALAVGSVMMFQLKDEDPASALDEMADAPAATTGEPIAAEAKGDVSPAPEDEDDEAERADAPTAKAAGLPGSAGEAPRQPLDVYNKASAVDGDGDTRPLLDKGSTVAPAFGARGGKRDRSATKLGKEAPAKDAEGIVPLMDEPATRGPSAAKTPTSKARSARTKAKRESPVAGKIARAKVAEDSKREAKPKARAKKSKAKATTSIDERRSRAAAPPARRAPAPAAVNARREGAARSPDAAAEKAFAPPPPADDARLAGGDLEAADDAAPLEEREAMARPGVRGQDTIVGRASAADEADKARDRAPNVEAKEILEAEEATLDDLDAPSAPVAPAPTAAQVGDGFAPAPIEARKDNDSIASPAGGGGAKMVAPTTIVIDAPRRAIQLNRGSAGAQPVADSLSVGGAPRAPMPQAAPQAVPQSLTEARAARARGDHRAAVGAYARYFERQPRDSQFSRSLFEAAASHEALGQIQQALRMYGLVPSTAGQWYVRARARIDALRAARAAESGAIDEAADAEERVDPKPEPPRIEPPR